LSILAAICVFLGGGIGACLRWGLAMLLNPVSHVVPLGTLTANLIGGYLIGIAAAVLAFRPDLPNEVRLFAVTGLLGGFTTFSAFSHEVVALVAAGRPVWATVTAATQVAGSLALTALGIATVRMMANP
jgi:fluoride exporter